MAGSSVKLRSYDPTCVKFIWNGHIFVGFAEGTFIEASRDEDNFSNTYGGDGSLARTKTTNRGGTITLTLQQNSPSNKYLSGIQIADDNTCGLTTGEAIVEDRSEGNIMTGSNVAIMTPASMAYADDQSPKTWVFHAEYLQYTQ